VAKSLGAGPENVFLSGRTTGTISGLIDEFCSRFNVTRAPEFEMYAYAAIREANRQLFGRPVVPTFRIDKADFLLTVGSDVCDTFLSPVEYTAQIAELKADEHFNWYHAEPHTTLTGVQAIHKLSLKPGSEAYLLAHLLRELRERGAFAGRRVDDHLAAVPVVSVGDVTSKTGLHREDVEKLVQDYMSAHAPLVIAGGVSTRHAGGLDVARLAALLQYASGMIGKTVDIDRPLDYSHVGTMSDVVRLIDKLARGDVGVMFVADTDPATRLPAAEGARFADSLGKAALPVGIGEILTETLSRCDVVLPASHALESWGDTQPRAGLVSAVQPAIEPLHDTRSLGDILLQLIAETGAHGGTPADSYQTYLLDRWRRRYGASGTEALITNGYLVLRQRGGAPDVSLAASPGRYSFDAAPDPGDTALLVTPSLRFYDGRSRALALLNEIPDPLSSVTWDRWLSVAPTTATRLGLKERGWAEISAGDWSTELPVVFQPGMHDGVAMMEEGTAPTPAGWDRASGEVGALIPNVSIRKIASKGHLTDMAGSKKVETEGHIPLELVPHHGHHEEGLEREDVTFYPVPDYPDYRWALAIDLDRCTGCSACVAACYVENNVPIVGRDEHLKGREMSWLAIQPYYNDDESAELMPVMCQHCDNAPCEPVCPVFATYHNDEGLNAQVYNRCVGTRYCANNCPYKVRRFNWFDHRDRPEPLGEMFNPDVSRRGKGIMEKCSLCVQRIRKARDVAKDEGRKIGADEVSPACAQTCPGDAIVFGNIKDENSEVARWARSENSHRALEELGTGPAVYYLKKGNGHEEHG
jgi:molybdopterin-containing oxidoreductase family iron-sulfur binding subunit